jgi:hypothetical protein
MRTPVSLEYGVQSIGSLDRLPPSHVSKTMATKNTETVWSIIERLQRRLERDGMSPAAVDKAVSLALRSLIVSGR